MNRFSRLATNLVNVGLYELGWLCCVLGAAWGYPVAGALATWALVGVHLALVENLRDELELIGIACLLGVVIDSLQQLLGLFTFTSHPAWPLWLPLWVPVIWAQFATLFRFALRGLKGRYLLAALLGVVGGPLAYVGGIKLGAASFGSSPTLTVTVLAAVWAGVTPLLVWLGERGAAGSGRYRWPGR